MLVEMTKAHMGSLSKNVPEVKLVNLYLAQNPLTPSGVSYISRPSVSQVLATLPTSPIRGIFYQQGWLNDTLFVVSGDTLYSVKETGTFTVVGKVPGTSLCHFCSTSFHTLILSDGIVYLFDGSGVTSVAAPDNLLFSDVSSLNNYFVLVVNQSNKFFWIAPGDDFIDPLSFASAESNPDYLQSVKTVSDELWFLGNTTTEVWSPSGDSNAPFLRVSGRVFNSGCVSNLSAVSALVDTLPCIIWVSPSNEVLLGQGGVNKISTDFVEEVLKDSAYYRSWYFRRQRNDFYVLSTDKLTLVYDLSAQTWYKWSTFNLPYWFATTGVQKNGTVFVTDILTSSNIYTLEEQAKDNVTDWLVCEVSGIIPNPTRASIACNSLDVGANFGYASIYGTSPIIELRWSDDQGANWATYLQNVLGARGSTKEEVSFRSLGRINQPGRLIEIRFSGVDNFRLDYINMNGD